MWNWRAKNARKRTSKTSAAQPAIENLENRALLAGNVIASLNGSHLTVTGDAADNAIDVTVLDNTVVIRGLNNTTINGGTDAFIVAANSDTIAGVVQISMGAGNDSVAFSRNVKLTNTVIVNGEAGNDSISSTGATFGGATFLRGMVGNDTFSLQDSAVTGYLVIHGNRGDDLVSLKNVNLSGWTQIKTQLDNDGVSLDGVTGTSHLAILTGHGDDNVIVQNSTISGFVHIKTRQSEDVVTLEDNTFNSHVHVNLGRDNDGLVVRGTNTFNEVFTVQGGDSRQNSGSDLPNGDASSVAATNVFNKGRFLRRVEASTIATAVTDRIDATTTGLIARAVAADTAAQTLSGLSISATATAAADKSVTSDGVLITKDANVTISGTTLPNATVTLDTDNDGVFDDATTTADATGAYSVQVTLTRKDLYTADATANDQLTGLQTVKVKSSLASGENNTASVVVDLIKSTNSLIKYTTQDKDGKVQEYYLELFNSEAPIAVANFLKYSADGRYEDSIIHRSVDNFVIQGGGFTVEDGIVNAVNTDAAITGEFNAARGNIKGTISMAHTGDPNSGTSQWFLNLKDNADLDDFATKRHTVFGRVVGNGQTVIDAIGALEQVNLQTATSSGALTEVPLRATFVEFARTLTGTIEATANSTQLIGTGTKFLTELKGSTVSGALRSRIQINGQSFFVASISDDTHLTLTAAPATGGTGLTGKTDFAEDDNFVRFSSIVEVLKTT